MTFRKRKDKHLAAIQVKNRNVLLLCRNLRRYDRHRAAGQGGVDQYPLVGHNWPVNIAGQIPVARSEEDAPATSLNGDGCVSGGGDFVFLHSDGSQYGGAVLRFGVEDEAIIRYTIVGEAEALAVEDRGRLPPLNVGRQDGVGGCTFGQVHAVKSDEVRRVFGKGGVADAELWSVLFAGRAEQRQEKQEGEVAPIRLFVSFKKLKVSIIGGRDSGAISNYL